MNTHNINLHSDLGETGRIDALVAIREAVWGINARNILRTLVEEVAGDSPEEEEEEDEFSFKSGQREELDKEGIDIEVVDGLTLHVKYVYNRRNRAFGAAVISMMLETNGKTFVFDAKYALEQNVNILAKGTSTQTFAEFVEEHQALADATPAGGNEEQIDILIDALFDFTDIEEVW